MSFTFRGQCYKHIRIVRKDGFLNKSKFITEDHFTKQMNITIH